MNAVAIRTAHRGSEPATVAGWLRHHAEHRPDALAYRFLTDDQGTAEEWSYRRLDQRARATAARLQDEGQRGRPVLVLQEPGLEYIANFLGCLYAGAIAVPAYPPDTSRFGQTMARLAAIAHDARATHALTTAALQRFAAEHPDELEALGLGTLRWLATETFDDAEAWCETEATGGSLAFLQYTSGSTSAPKGVMVSNDNLIANLRSIHRHLEHDERTQLVSWLPPYHDMGLIGGILEPLYLGVPAHLMAPFTFIRRPLLWLETLSRTGASTSVAPNFGFEHCLRRITPRQRDTLDLRHWTKALNGAEPVRAETLERFAEYFAPCGFDRRALLPCYGLAEATLMVTGAAVAEPPTVRTFATPSIEAGSPEPATAGSARVTEAVGCGAPIPDIEMAIVDPATLRRVPAGAVGEIWVTGPNCARGYWRRPEATRETFQARIEGEAGTAYMRTGDLGFLHEGQLYVTGRIKDVVILSGRNHYPPDLELTVERAAAVRAGGGAAFGINVDGAEELVVVYEVDGAKLENAGALLAAIRTAVATEHEVTPHTVALLKRSAVPKTTSGKTQRQACRQEFLGLGLPVLAASVTRDVDAPAGRDGLDMLSAAERRARVIGALAAEFGDAAVEDAALIDAAIVDTALADLGLDYPALIQVVRRLEARLGVEIPVGELLVRPRISTLLSLCLGDALAAQEEPDAVEQQREEPREAGPSAGEIETWLVERVAGRLGLPGSAIDIDQPFATIGLDSKQATAIAEELSRHLGRATSSALVFDHPSIRRLARHLSPAPVPQPQGPPPAPSRPRPAMGVDHGGEPIAITGMACRFPGAPDISGFWRLLLDGRDAVAQVPSDRWDPETVPAPSLGGFLDEVGEFDARFFGISAREAERMDPQQRLLLELAWLALEDGGVAPTGLAGSDTGVFVGLSNSDYGRLQLRRLDAIDLYSATGSAHALAANRLSYVLDLTGPSLTLDTACSSSLAAVHAACQSLRAGECRAALVGGVNLLLAPGLTKAFADGGMLAADGHCRVFDDAASGYVRGEGAGVLLLKPLSAAIADGDRIYATIKGSGVGHGGRSNGLTAPKSSAQRAVIERALTAAGLRPGQIGYVEAHGTGTPLGDPVEWEALAATYGRERTGEPCLVGSVKANIGHLEAAAGIAGLIKAALVLHHRRVPPQLHLTTPSRRLAWDSSGLDVPTEARPLADPMARAAVSSFGFGGHNAHVILECAPSPAAVVPQDTLPERPIHVLCLSGHTPSALATLAHRYRSHLAADPGVALGDLSHAANTARAHLSHRAAVLAGSTAELDTALEPLTRGESSATVLRAEAGGRSEPRVAFLFSGQGTQYAGMGEALYRGHPVVRHVLDHCDRVLRPLDVPLLNLMFDQDGAARLERTRYCQPALVALEIALAELWMSLGVQPTAVLGHSVGAISAACVAGALPLDDALRLAAARGRHMDQQPGDGAMIACVGDADTIRSVADRFASVAVAAVNTPRHLVLSGSAGEIEAAREALEACSAAVRPLRVSHAFHSKLMAGAVAPVREAARRIEFATPALPWISDATGRLAGQVDADAWVEHMLGTVHFAAGFETARGLGCDAFVEIGPHPTLLGFGREMTPAGELDGALWLPSLRRGATEPWEPLLRSLGRLHCAGGTVDWAALDAGRRRPPTAVPHAVFERRPYWFVPADAQEAQISTAPGHEAQNLPAATVPRAAGRPSVSRDGLLGHIARICGYPANEIASQARLGVDLGFDSLMRTELERCLGADLGRPPEELRGTLPEDPTVGQILNVLGGDTGTDAVPATPAAAPEPAPAAAPAAVPEAVRAPAPEPTPAPAAAPLVERERFFEESEEYQQLRARRAQAEADGANPYGRIHSGFNASRTSLDGRPVTNFAAFNYLALSHHPRVREAAKAAIDRYGTSTSATPLLFGETPLHHELDAELASFLGTDAAIVFAGGHATNVATIGHLFGPQDLILHDEWIHDSTIRGCVLSGARRRPFRHSDWQAVEELLRGMRSQYRRAVIVIEGVYSQDGDVPDLPALIDIKKKYDAMLMIDEAHSVGVLGATGRGIGEHHGVERRDVDLWMGTLSKAIGSLGGYIAARSSIIEYLKFTTPLYIFSTGISPANAAAALEALRVIQDEPERVARLRSLSEYLRAGARARGLDTGVSHASAIVPVITGEWQRTMAISNRLLEQGVNAMPIGYPAVARDQCRLRFFANAEHSESDLDYTLDLLGGLMTGSEDSAARRSAPAAVPAPSRRDADVLVVGASGFIGGHLTRRLVEQGRRVRVLMRPGSDRSGLDALPVEVEVGGLDDEAALRSAVRGVRHVYNVAGKSADWGDWRDFERTNIDGCRALVEAAGRAGTVERLLHTSTTDVYGYPVRPCDESAEPRDIGLPYNRSKVRGELAVREAAERTGLPVTIVRPVSVYGPRSKDFVIEIANLLVHKQMVYIGGGAVPAGLLYVANAVDAMIAACESEATAGRAYNLRDPELTTWREYIEALADGLGLKRPSFSLPGPVAMGVARTSEALYGALRLKARPLLTRHAVHLFDRDQSYGIDRAREDFGFKSAVSFEEGMRYTVAWLDSTEGRICVPRS